MGKRVERPTLVLLSGILYTLGRTISYFVIAFIAVKSLVSVPRFPTMGAVLGGVPGAFIGIFTLAPIGMASGWMNHGILAACKIR